MLYVPKSMRSFLIYGPHADHGGVEFLFPAIRESTQ